MTHFQIKKEWGKLDLNQRPAGYESAALTTELLPLKEGEVSARGARNQWGFFIAGHGASQYPVTGHLGFHLQRVENAFGWF